MKRNILYSILFIFFTFIFIVFYLGLDKDNFYAPNEIQKKKLVEFTANEFFSNKQVNSKDIIDNSSFTLLNIWSSWCAPCRSEHSMLMDLKKKSNLYIVGLNYKDKKNNANKFLNDLGNPFSKILVDSDGTLSILLGAYGIPETLILDNQSNIVKKYIGPLTNENVLEIINITNK